MKKLVTDRPFTQFLVYHSPYLAVLAIFLWDVVCHRRILSGPIDISHLGLEQLRSPDNSSSILIASYSELLMWISAMKLHVLLCFAGLIAAGVRLNNLYLDLERPLRNRINLLGLGAALALLPSIVYIFVVSHSSKHEYTEVYWVVHVLTSDRYEGVLPWIPWLDGLSVATALFLAAVASRVITPIVRPTDSLDRKIARVSVKLQTIRFLLYFGMVILVTNVVQTRAFLSISLPHVKGSDASARGDIEQVTKGTGEKTSDAQKNLTNVINGLVTARGVLSTCMLAAIFFPATFFLREEAYKLAIEAKPEAPVSERESWLQERGLIATVAELIPRFAAVLAPLIAGPLSELIKRPS